MGMEVARDLRVRVGRTRRTRGDRERDHHSCHRQHARERAPALPLNLHLPSLKWTRPAVNALTPGGWREPPDGRPPRGRPRLGHAPRVDVVFPPKRDNARLGRSTTCVGSAVPAGDGRARCQARVRALLRLRARVGAVVHRSRPPSRVPRRALHERVRSFSSEGPSRM